MKKKESSSKEKDSINKKIDKKHNYNYNSLDNSTLKENFKFIKYTQKTINNNASYIMKSNKVKEQKIKRTKNNEFLIFDPVSQKLLNGKLKVNIQYILIENLRFGKYLFEIICLLGLMPLREFTIEMCEKICLNLNSYNTNEESIITCSSPLLSIALSAELLNKLGNISTWIKYNADSISKSLLFLGYNIQTSIANEETLNY